SYPPLSSFLIPSMKYQHPSSFRIRIIFSSHANYQRVTPALFGISDSVEFEAVRIDMASQTNSDSNSFVLDMVSDVCRIEGFNVEKNKPPERQKVPGTLHVSRTVASKILAYGIENGSVLRLTSMPKLEFRPYFFADFTLNHGKKRKAKGVIVFDGVDGRECDAGL